MIRYIKICLCVCDICCVVLGCIFMYQIIMQKAQFEKKSQINLILQQESKILYDTGNIFAQVKNYKREYEEINQAIKDKEKQYQEMEIFYNKKLYLDSIVNQMDKINGNTFYIDRYFEIEKEELLKILSQKDNNVELDGTLNDSGEYGLLLPIGNKIWLRYEEDDNLPIGIVILNSEIDVGSPNVKLGMSLSDMKEMISDYKEGTVILENSNIYYILCQDSKYMYYYAAIESDCATILYIALA